MRCSALASMGLTAFSFATKNPVGPAPQFGSHRARRGTRLGGHSTDRPDNFPKDRFTEFCLRAMGCDSKADVGHAKACTLGYSSSLGVLWKVNGRNQLKYLERRILNPKVTESTRPLVEAFPEMQVIGFLPPIKLQIEKGGLSSAIALENKMMWGYRRGNMI